jgi:hypothetical protein
MLTRVLLNMIKSSVPVHCQSDFFINLDRLLCKMNVLQTSTLHIVHLNVINKPSIVGLATAFRK